MTVHTISSHTLNGSEVWGPYTAPDDTAWIKVSINTPPHADPTYRRMFLEPVWMVVERSLDGETWAPYGACHIEGDLFTTVQGRDSFKPATLWISVLEDGYQYRATVTTTYSQTITGSVEFDTTSARLDLDTTGSNIEIVEAYVVLYDGPYGHATGPVREFISPKLHSRTDNPAVVVYSIEHYPLYFYPDQCIVSGPGGDYVSTGDHKKVKWGIDGDEIPRIIRPGSRCTLSAPMYVQAGLPDIDDVVHVDFYPNDPEGWLSGGTPPELREISVAALCGCAVMVCNNIKQDEPVYSSWASNVVNSTPTDIPSYDGGYFGTFTTVLSTLAGQLVLGSGIEIQASADGDPYVDGPSGATELLNEYLSWSGDEWGVNLNFQVASGSSTTAGARVGMTPGFSSGEPPYVAAGAMALAETKFVHLVIVETPGDENDLPDANQIRAGNDGFDDPALYYTKRGPDADGTVRFDPTSIPGLGELTDVTFCAVYDDGTVPLYFNQTTAQAIHCVAVEDPGNESLYPDAQQIKDGTDYYDDPAPYVKKLTLPLTDGTEQFGSFAGLDPDTDYLFAFVTGEEAPVYMQASTLGAALLELQGTYQTQESETVGLIQASTLAAVGTSQDQTSQNSDLAQANTLTAQNTTQSQTSQNSGLTVAGQLGVQDTSQAQASQNSDLIIQYSLSVNNTTQSQTSGELSLELSDALVVPATTQAQTSEPISLVQSNILQAGNTSQTQSSQNSLLGDRIPGALIAEEIRIIPAIGSLPIRAMPALSSTPRIIGPN